MRYGFLIVILFFMGACLNTVPEIEELQGEYKDTFVAPKVFYQEVKVEYLKGRTISFCIETANNRGCTGELKGVVELDSNLFGSFITDSLNNIKVDFQFGKNELQIIERIANHEQALQIIENMLTDQKKVP